MELSHVPPSAFQQRHPAVTVLGFSLWQDVSWFVPVLCCSYERNTRSEAQVHGPRRQLQVRRSDVRQIRGKQSSVTTTG
jgi:hypothetical protein